MLSTGLSNLDLGAKGLWFPLVVIIALLLTLILIPKTRINRIELYIIFCIIGFATWVADSFILRVFDIIDLGSPVKPGLGDILSYTFIPSSLGCLFLCFLDRKNIWKLSLLFTIISFAIELGMELSGYMKVKGLFNVFSVFFYFIMYRFALPFHLRLIRRR